MSVVLDASALIAFLRDETGAQLVEDYVRSQSPGAYAHALNLCEVYYDFFRTSGENVAESIIQDLFTLGVQERTDMNSSFWREVARLKAIHRRISLADCCGVTLANRLGAVFVSADRHELEPLSTRAACRIEFIR